MTLKLLRNNIYHTKRVEEIAYRLDIKEEIVEETISLMYEYIKLKLEEVDIDEDKILTEEEFNKNFPTIHIPSLGYIQPSYKKYLHIMNSVQKKKKRDEKNKS